MRLFDTHLHIVDPRFPLVPNQGYLPEPFTVDDYRARFTAHGGAVVSGSFQAYDQTYLIDALQRLGPTFVGVAQVPPEITDEEVLAPATPPACAPSGRTSRAARRRRTSLDLARRFDELAGWHLEVYADAATCRRCPASRLVIDHLGGPEAALPTTLRLVEQGAHVKATRFGASDHDIPRTLRAIAAVNPGRAAVRHRSARHARAAPVRARRPRARPRDGRGTRALGRTRAETYLVPSIV